MTTRRRHDLPRWVWAHEFTEVLDRHMGATGLTLGGLAREVAERFGLDPESVERRLRAARRSGRVVCVYQADRVLTVAGLSLLDLPSYARAFWGHDPPHTWPRRGDRRGDVPCAA
jgi:hypothetical protein